MAGKSATCGFEVGRRMSSIVAILDVSSMSNLVVFLMQSASVSSLVFPPGWVRSASATNLCGDSTYSFSQHRRGTCSHHGGVATWL